MAKRVAGNTGHRKVALKIGAPMRKRALQVEGRRLVIHDLGGIDACSGLDLATIAACHQQRFLGRTLQVLPSTYFKTIAIRAHNGWDPTHNRRLTAEERRLRLRLAETALFPNPVPAVETSTTGLRKRAVAA
jgi:hypothetical protein